jgi:hypothetical protein
MAQVVGVRRERPVTTSRNGSDPAQRRDNLTDRQGIGPWHGIVLQ